MSAVGAAAVRKSAQACTVPSLEESTNSGWLTPFPSAAFSFPIFEGLYLWLLSAVFQRELWPTTADIGWKQLVGRFCQIPPNTNTSHECPHSSCLTLLCMNLAHSPSPPQCGISQLCSFLPMLSFLIWTVGLMSF